MEFLAIVGAVTCIAVICYVAVGVGVLITLSR
ncbi:membrane protein [Gordonia phage Neville]|uniref:Membrane protein n=1 Tax=Gordonia phage Neville TaxID=2301693 RepID=A0A385E0P2_9CAUD|nr:membrane protein [Gordonia phage Neville]AXQ64498.1 membrane protein [Gordonia phage Neville]